MGLTFKDFKIGFLTIKKDFDFLLNKENREIFKDYIGIDAAVILQVIVIRAEQLANSEPNIYFEPDGSLSFPVNQIKEITRLTEKRQKDALNVLEEVGLIRVEYKKADYREEGFRTNRIVLINFDRIASFVDNFVAYLTVLNSKFKYRYDFKKILK